MKIDKPPAVEGRPVRGGNPTTAPKPRSSLPPPAPRTTATTTTAAGGGRGKELAPLGLLTKTSSTPTALTEASSTTHAPSASGCSNNHVSSSTKSSSQDALQDAIPANSPLFKTRTTVRRPHDATPHTRPSKSDRLTTASPRHAHGAERAVQSMTVIDALPPLRRQPSVEVTHNSASYLSCADCVVLGDEPETGMTNAAFVPLVPAPRASLVETAGASSSHSPRENAHRNNSGSGRRPKLAAKATPTPGGTSLALAGGEPKTRQQSPLVASPPALGTARALSVSMPPHNSACSSPSLRETRRLRAGESRPSGDAGTATSGTQGRSSISVVSGAATAVSSILVNNNSQLVSGMANVGSPVGFSSARTVDAGHHVSANPAPAPPASAATGRRKSAHFIPILDDTTTVTNTSTLTNDLRSPSIAERRRGGAHLSRENSSHYNYSMDSFGSNGNSLNHNRQTSSSGHYGGDSVAGHGGLSTSNMRVQLAHEALIGKGRFGMVFQAMDRETNRILAVKEISLGNFMRCKNCVVTEEMYNYYLTGVDDNASNSNEPSADTTLSAESSTELQRHLGALRREITLLRQLNHPNIVKYLGSDVSDGCLRIFMEYVAGGSISKLLKQYVTFEEQQAANFTEQIVQGLAYLHARNIVHRDLKGDNLLVDLTGTVKLADFGTARSTEVLSGHDDIAGTAHFIAPEVLKGHVADEKADIWSLGCCVIEMLTGRPPLSEYKSPYSVMMHVADFAGDLRKEYIPAHNTWSHEAVDFIERCLCRDAAERPTAQALLSHPWLIAARQRRALSEQQQQQQQLLLQQHEGSGTTAIESVAPTPFSADVTPGVMVRGAWLHGADLGQPQNSTTSSSALQPPAPPSSLPLASSTHRHKASRPSSLLDNDFLLSDRGEYLGFGYKSAESTLAQAESGASELGANTSSITEASNNTNSKSNAVRECGATPRRQRRSNASTNAHGETHGSGTGRSRNRRRRGRHGTTTSESPGGGATLPRSEMADRAYEHNMSFQHSLDRTLDEAEGAVREATGQDAARPRPSPDWNAHHADLLYPVANVVSEARPAALSSHHLGQPRQLCAQDNSNSNSPARSPFLPSLYRLVPASPAGESTHSGELFANYPPPATPLGGGNVASSMYSTFLETVPHSGRHSTLSSAVTPVLAALSLPVGGAGGVEHGVGNCGGNGRNTGNGGGTHGPGTRPFLTELPRAPAPALHFARHSLVSDTATTPHLPRDDARAHGEVAAGKPQEQPPLQSLREAPTTPGEGASPSSPATSPSRRQSGC